MQLPSTNTDRAAALRVSFKTLGCRLNQAETAQLSVRFREAGYAVVPFEAPSEVCVIHTCAVTRQAVKEALRLTRVLRKRRPGPLVVLAGCAVQVDPDHLLTPSEADLFVGQEAKYNLPERVDAAIRRTGRLPSPASEAHPPDFETTRALVKVQDGCEFRCAYCIVPDARGACRSRPIPDIAREVESLSAAGYREVVLTGANLGCYQDGARRLVDLLARVSEVPGIRRIRISSVELSTVEREVIEYMAQSDKLCRYLHLPLQSGDDHVLARMRRRYSARQYREFVTFAVDRIPLLGLGADLIAGLPGEDAAAFANTVRLVEDLPFSNLHVFPYSPRPGTAAAAMPNQVPHAERKSRAAALIELGRAKKRTFARRLVGQRVSVLVEKTTTGRSAGGWTSEYAFARIPGAAANDIIEFVPTACDAKGVLEGAQAI